MKTSIFFYFMLGCLIIASSIIGCAPQSSEKDITLFSFEKKNNETYIIGDINGVIKDTEITVPVPVNVAKGNLVATFTTTGKTVQVNSIEQKSGVTTNDFSKPVTYVVTAQDGSVKEYTIHIRIGEVVQNGKKFNLSNELQGVGQTVYKNEKYLLLDMIPMYELSLPENDILIKSSIESLGIGADNIWLTSDDILHYNYMMVSDTRTVHYKDFANTMISHYKDYTIDNGKVTKMLGYNASGINGKWFDDDDQLYVVQTYEYDSEGKRITFIEYMGNSSSMNKYVKYAYNNDNKLDTIKEYNDSSQSDLLSTLKFNYIDSKLISLDMSQIGFAASTKITYDANGRIYQIEHYIYNNNPILLYVWTRYYNEYGYISRQEFKDCYQNDSSSFYATFTYEIK